MTEHVAYVTLGSNIDPHANLIAAIAHLRRHDPDLICSPVYRTPPQGYADQPDFYNMAVRLVTALDPAALKESVLAPVEMALGRVRDPHNKNAPRTIDLDIALWDESALTYGAKPWRIPDPDILRFAHVAIPLADLAPDYRYPETGETLAQIAARLDCAGMQRIEPAFI